MDGFTLNRRYFSMYDDLFRDTGEIERENFIDIYSDFKRSSELIKALFYIAGSLGFFFNLGLFCILVRHRGSSKFQIPLLTSLSFTDMVIAVLSIIYHDVCFFSIWKSLDECDGKGYTDSYFLKVTKIVVGLIYSVTQWAGLLVLYAVTFDMLIAVFKSLCYRRCKLRYRGRLVVLLIWLLSLFLVAIDYLSINIFAINKQVLFVSTSSISLATFLMTYSAISCRIWYHVKNSPTKKMRSMKKGLITMLLIVCTYCICFMPFLWIFVVIWRDNEREEREWTNLATIFHLVYVMNTVLDPIICVVRLSEVRKYLKRLFSVPIKEKVKSPISAQTTQQTSV